MGSDCDKDISFSEVFEKGRKSLKVGFYEMYITR